MINWYKIEDHLIPAENAINKIKLAGKSICLINHKNKYFATSSKCPHAGADLSDGWCENGQLVCPYHRHAFDLKNGRGVIGQGNFITIYPLEKRGAEWFIGIKLTFIQKLFKK